MTPGSLLLLLSAAAASTRRAWHDLRKPALVIVRRVSLYAAACLAASASALPRAAPYTAISVGSSSVSIVCTTSGKYARR